MAAQVESHHSGTDQVPTSSNGGRYSGTQGAFRVLRHNIGWRATLHYRGYPSPGKPCIGPGVATPVSVARTIDLTAGNRTRSTSFMTLPGFDPGSPA